MSDRLHLIVRKSWLSKKIFTLGSRTELYVYREETYNKRKCQGDINDAK